MCPAHLSMLAIAAVPASLGALGYLSLRWKRNVAPPDAGEKEA